MCTESAMIRTRFFVSKEKRDKDRDNERKNELYRKKK